MMRKVFFIIALSAAFAWFLSGQTKLATQLKDKDTRARITNGLGVFKERMKESKITFAGKEIPLHFTQDDIIHFVKTESKAQRALFIFGLFLFNIWLIPLLGGAKQRRLKQELFDLHPQLIVDNMSESRQTPYYSSTFLGRIFCSLQIGSFFLVFAFFSAAAALFAGVGLVTYAAISCRLKTKKYESVESFKEAIVQGSGSVYMIKQIISYFAPPMKKTAFDQVYQDALVKAEKKNSNRKAS